MMINTPRWRNKFRQEICDSEHIRFEGPEEPEKINIPVRADISPDSISLLPIADSFPKDSKSVSFSLKIMVQDLYLSVKIIRWHIKGKMELGINFHLKVSIIPLDSV